MIRTISVPHHHSERNISLRVGLNQVQPTENKTCHANIIIIL